MMMRQTDFDERTRLLPANNRRHPSSPSSSSQNEDEEDDDYFYREEEEEEEEDARTPTSFFSEDTDASGVETPSTSNSMSSFLDGKFSPFSSRRRRKRDQEDEDEDTNNYYDK